MTSAMKWSFRALVMSVVLGVLATSAYAAQNVANTSQKGSLLVFPLIDVSGDNNTVIRLANDANVQVDVKCYYVNGTKFRRDFLFKLTKKQAISFDARSGSSDVLGNLPPFPTDIGAFPNITVPPGIVRPADPFRGELICFAVNPAGSTQISHNHLSGTATVGNDALPVDQVLLSSFEYNSWNFTARAVARGAQVGAVPGRLDLTGVAGAYDACPAYNIVHLSPTIGPFLETQFIDQRIGVSLCAQDLRQDYIPHYTKLELHIWNAHEVKFTGSWECSDSTHSFLVSTVDVLPDNLSRETLGTDAAHMQIRGVASAQCITPRLTETIGLVAVSARVLRQVENGETALHGTTANTAGVHPIAGFVLWDPQDAEVPEAPQR
jgi:hypothetical protein